MDSQERLGFRREDRLVVEGDLVVEFAGGFGDLGDDRVSVGKYDLHDLIASQFCTSAEAVQHLGKFRLIMERVV